VSSWLTLDPMNTTAVTSRHIAELAAAIGRHLTADPERSVAAAVGALKRSSVSADSLVELELAVDEGLQRVVLHAEPTFSVQAVVWAPGHSTAVHDHRSWCAFRVLAGSVEEARYRREGDEISLVARTVLPVGETTGFAPPDDIHSVGNTGPTAAVTLHVYGVDLGDGGSAVSRWYRDPAHRVRF
jgi:predicted metal-dependent enzyme (double-stranded beta helix superfamily)